MKKAINVMIFVLSVVCLAITAALFQNTAVFCDEFNTTPANVFGGMAGLVGNWVKMMLLAVLSVVSAINVFLKK
ncbi:MAG: hypothetical protein IJ499_03595 [Clostridia bacterium]|nr:hypothetical protein [Clostridia bacterium]